MKFFTALVAATIASQTNGYQTYLDNIPNGKYWGQYLGHVSTASTTLSSFGQLYKSVNGDWSKMCTQKCLPNEPFKCGQMFGDPCCVWKKGDKPRFEQTNLNIYSVPDGSSGARKLGSVDYVYLCPADAPFPLPTIVGPTGTSQPPVTAPPSGTVTPTPTTTTPKPPTTTPTTTTPTTAPTPTPTPGTTPAIKGLACNYEGSIWPICRQANAWSYENGAVCVGVSRCSSQSAPYGVVIV